MGVIQIENKEEAYNFFESHKTVIICGTADWSDPGKAINPFFDKYADDIEYDEDKVAFIKFEDYGIPDLAEELNIRNGTPAFFIFESGERVYKLEEVNPHALKRFMEDTVERSKRD